MWLNFLKWCFLVTFLHLSLFSPITFFPLPSCHHKKHHHSYKMHTIYIQTCTFQGVWVEVRGWGGELSPPPRDKWLLSITARSITAAQMSIFTALQERKMTKLKCHPKNKAGKKNCTLHWINYVKCFNDLHLGQILPKPRLIKMFDCRADVTFMGMLVSSMYFCISFYNLIFIHFFCTKIPRTNAHQIYLIKLLPCATTNTRPHARAHTHSPYLGWQAGDVLIQERE